MYEVLKTEKFAVFFSFIIGVSIIAILIPVCKGKECFIKKAPSVNEMKRNTYRIGSKCYQFKPETIECPASGVIESFRGMGGAEQRGRLIFKETPIWSTKDTVALMIVLILCLVGAGSSS
jgi:hypothetical protein